MIHAFKTFFILLTISVLCSNCNHYYYAPNTVQTPILQQRHDAEVSLGVARGQNLQGYELQGVYSPVKHGAVMFNYFQAQGRNRDSGGFNWGKGRLTEFGLGGYLPTKKGSAALFAGWGQGFVENHYLDEGNSILHFDRIFFQPTIATQGKFFRFGAGLRIVQVRFGKGQITHLSDTRELYNLQQIEVRSPLVFPEIALNGGLWIGPMTMGISATLVNSNRATIQNFSKSNISFRTTIALQSLWRKPKTEVLK